MENNHIISRITAAIINPSRSINLHFPLLNIALADFIRSLNSCMINLRDCSFLGIRSRLELLVTLSPRSLVFRGKSRGIVLRVVHSA